MGEVGERKSERVLCLLAQLQKNSRNGLSLGTKQNFVNKARA